MKVKYQSRYDAAVRAGQILGEDFDSAPNEIRTRLVQIGKVIQEIEKEFLTEYAAEKKREWENAHDILNILNQFESL